MIGYGENSSSDSTKHSTEVWITPQKQTTLLPALQYWQSLISLLQGTLFTIKEIPETSKFEIHREWLLRNIHIMWAVCMCQYSIITRNWCSQLIWYARAGSVYDRFLNQCLLLTNNFLCFNDLIWSYNLPLGWMLSDVFNTNC